MSQHRTTAIVAGSAAAIILGSQAFTLSPGAAPGGVVPERVAHRATQQSGYCGSAFAATAGAAGVMAVGAVAGRSRRSVGQKKVTCAASEEPLVIAEQPGATAPLGFFDPLGFTKSPLMTYPGDPTGFKHLRAAEIKHGRVAMMGSVGSAFAHYVKFPFFENVPTGLKALDTDMGSKGFVVLFAVVGLIEASNWKPSEDEPGSYGDPFNLGQYTPEMRNREINNGRMAMFAMLGQLVAEMVTGDDPIVQFGL